MWIEGDKGPAVDELRLEELLLGHERGDAGLWPEEIGRARKRRRWMDWVEMDPEVGGGCRWRRLGGTKGEDF